jgi:hypothetical protein
MATVEITVFNKQLTVESISKLLLFQHKYISRPVEFKCKLRTVFIGLDIFEIYLCLLFIIYKTF